MASSLLDVRIQKKYIELKQNKTHPNKTLLDHNQQAQSTTAVQIKYVYTTVVYHFAITLNLEMSLKCSSLTEHIIQFCAKFQNSSFN